MIDGWGVLYLVILGLVLPGVALRTARMLDSGMPFPPRRAVYAESSFWLTLILAASAFVAWRNRIDLGAWPRADPSSWIAGAVVFGIGLLAIPVRWWLAGHGERRRLAQLVPRRPGDWLLWSAVCVTAGVSEEVAFRGVFFTLLDRWLGSPILAALLGALAFTLGHAYQGRTGMILIFAFALMFQALVWFTRGVAVAVAVHTLYDLTAGLLFGRLARSYDQPIVAEDPGCIDEHEV